METKRTFQPDSIRYGNRRVSEEIAILEYSNIYEWSGQQLNNFFAPEQLPHDRFRQRVVPL